MILRLGWYLPKISWFVIPKVFRLGFLILVVLSWQFVLIWLVTSCVFLASNFGLYLSPGSI